jgi:hypothetical protein
VFYPLAVNARLYRITGTGDVWPTPLHGLGAYFSKGGRYNYATEATVYCAEDPLVVIGEAAFYDAMEWQTRISTHRFNPVRYPLVSRHKLWCFSINPAPAIVDLEHAQAISQFQHTPQMLLNPSLNPARGPHVPGQPLARDYFGTQDLAKDIRGHVPPRGSPDPRPEGVKAPAIRVKSIPNYRAHQLCLFAFPPAVHVPYENRSILLMECSLELQFLEMNPRRPVTIATLDIDWCRPQFRITGPGAGNIPIYAPRPGSRDYHPNRWYNLEIKFA